MRLYRYVAPNSSGWMEVRGHNETPPESPWRPATRRELVVWHLTTERLSIVELLLVAAVSTAIILLR